MCCICGIFGLGEARRDVACIFQWGDVEDHKIVGSRKDVTKVGQAAGGAALVVVLGGAGTGGAKRDWSSSWLFLQSGLDRGRLIEEKEEEKIKPRGQSLYVLSRGTTPNYKQQPIYLLSSLLLSSVFSFLFFSSLFLSRRGDFNAYLNLVAPCSTANAGEVLRRGQENKIITRREERKKGR
ncbi:hypothetical protein F4820DRAFT_182863 [Hypoxylon rubiginosum]|uniref:Uncharacterized protein n=1 Tax=Hypoxylon rubiginosum TaxID=110542 RepID=A0ACB9YI93_9PEZI|nr:hypothetical protein F4820DRAFT_182863 [Hypoxylon rubiginosum]